MIEDELMLAIDIGGTKIDVGICDIDGRIAARARMSTPAEPDPDQLFRMVETFLSDFIAQSSDERSDRTLLACGVGCGGPMQRTPSTVSPLNIPAWRDFPLAARLEEAIGMPVTVDNDAKALALGEGWKGAGRGRKNFMAMVVSTGVGGGIVLDGKLLHGDQGNAGHVGHVVVEPGGRLCACGARGCLEAEVSGRSIEAITGRAAAAADPDMVARAGLLVGRAVASVSNLLDLELTLVAGSVALGFGKPFFDEANAEMARCCKLDFSVASTVEPAGLGESGPLVGAAAVGWNAVGVDILAAGDPVKWSP